MYPGATTLMRPDGYRSSSHLALQVSILSLMMFFNSASKRCSSSFTAFLQCFSHTHILIFRIFNLLIDFSRLGRESETFSRTTYSDCALSKNCSDLTN